LDKPQRLHNDWIADVRWLVVADPAEPEFPTTSADDLASASAHSPILRIDISQWAHALPRQILLVTCQIPERLRISVLWCIDCRTALYASGLRVPVRYRVLSEFHC
jgi:hypothetical protein